MASQALSAILKLHPEQKISLQDQLGPSLLSTLLTAPESITEAQASILAAF